MVRKHQLRTYKGFNLHLVDAADCLGGVWPAIKPSNAVPKRLTTFYPKTASENSDAFCHFFVDDYRYEKIWNVPERYLPVVKKYAGAIMPNFSTYHIMPLPMQYWNLYRNRALMFYWQENGVDVIPLLQCGDPRTYDYAFEGLPIGGTYAIMNNGLMKTKEGRHWFFEFLEIALDAVKPDLLVAYGTKFDAPLPCDVIWYKNDNTARVQNNVPYITAADKKALLSASDDTVIDVDDAYEERMSVPKKDRYERAVSTTEYRNPLMYNDELEGWEPFYVRELGYALEGTNPPTSLPEGDNIQLSLDDITKELPC